MDFEMPMNTKPRREREWVSLIPYGLNEQHPDAYWEIFRTAWENRDQLGYACRILKDGCCDGCSLGTPGMRDWTMHERRPRWQSKLKALTRFCSTRM